jgi:RHS repeat-associated protein
MIGSNHTTYYYYSDAYASGTGTPPGQTFAYLTKVTDPLGHINSFTWGFNDGQIRSHKDPNNQTATYAYNDSGFLARLTQISDPDGGQTYVGYNDSAASMTVCKLLNTTGSTSACPVSGASSGNWVVNTTVRDGMSHTSQTQLTSDPVSTDYGNTLYDGFGRVYQQSNPTHCSSSPGSLPSSCSETTWGKTQTTYDTIGRKILQVNQDSTSQSWSYSGKTVTFTDENGNQWQRATDALGRLSSVLEPSGSSTAPSLETDYTYDVLGNLLSVKQNGVKGQDTARNRSFTYDALSRLLTSSNPESGAITYAYDANGNMSSKVSPAVNQTSGTQTMYYCYEPLNRLTYKFLYGGTLCSVSTPFPTSTHASEFAYDGAVLSGSTVSSPSFKNPIGHVTDEQDFQNGVLTFERVTPQFDAMGRFLQEYQSDYPNPANGARDQYQFTNTYDLAGDMTQWNNGSVVGSSTSVPALTFSAAYDGVARLSLLQATNPSSWGGYTWGSNTTSFPEYLVNLSSKSPAAYDPFSHIAYEEAGKTTSSATSGTAGLTISSSYDKRARIVSENALGYDNSGSALNSFGVIAVTGTEQSGDTGYVNVTLTDTNTSSETYGQVLATTSNVAWGSTSTPTSIVSALISQINSYMSKWIIPTKDDTDGTIGLASSTTDVNYGIELNVTDTANKAASFEFDFSSLAGGTAGANNNYTIYNYTVPPGGYAPNGNLLASSDMVMGDFAFQYDTLNRLTVIAPSENVGWGYSLGCYLYDSFGNRTLDVVIWDSINNGCTGYPTSDDSVYNSNNQVTTFVEEQYNLGSSPPSTQTTDTVKYDVAGNVTSDGINNYYYDAEGRLCALTNPLAGTAEGYLYDADGNRVAKGTINTLNCNIASGGNGFQMTNEFLLGPAGNQVTEINNTNPANSGVWAWAHSNVWAGANLDATYDWMMDNQTGKPVAALHFHLSDPLGTRRVQTDPLGGFQAQFYSLPFGDQYGYEIYTANEHADDATEHHFTNKEFDSESTNNYYIGARYYASTMGRFISPDHPFVDQHPDDPQSWNLYAYARNNPLILLDPTGLGCITDLGQGSDANHEKVEFNNSINSDDCAGQHGTWAPGDVSANNTGAYRGDDGSINFQVTTNTDGNVYYSSFRSGAQTDEDGTCLNGCQGASIAHAPTDWLSSQIVGGSLDGLMSFAANRFEPRRDGGFMALLAGPGFLPNASDNWAGPGGMGTPQGQGDWAAMAHDYNYHTNGITLSTYFNPFVSRTTAKALIQSDNYLIGHAGGTQAVKMGMFFGVVNAFQWAIHPYF